MAKIHRSRKQKIFYINFETIYVIEKMRPGGNFNCHKKKRKTLSSLSLAAIFNFPHPQDLPYIELLTTNKSVET